MSRSAHATEAPFGLTARYPSAPAGFDELIDRAGAVKPHWAPLLRELEALPPETRALRLEQINAKVRETGIAHDLFADPGSLAQPWRIDLVPLIIPADEWRWLERALMQRARLCESLLADLHGPQRLLDVGGHPAPARLLRPVVPAAVPQAAADARLHPVLRRRHRPLP